MDRRTEIEQALESQRDYIGQWEKEQKQTVPLAEHFSKVVRDRAAHPIIRLNAFEALAQLTEREEPTNREIVQELLAIIFSEPDEEMQNAELGILGSRVNDTWIAENFNALSDSVRAQSANMRDALLNELRIDKNTPPDIREFANIVADPLRKNSALWQRLDYMSRLYRADSEELWTTMQEVPPHAPDHDEGALTEFTITQQKGRRLLSEGSVCGPEKQTQAERYPRRFGPEQGQQIPLRVFIGIETPDGKFQSFSIRHDLARAYIAELRDINDSRRVKGEERREARAEHLRMWKERLWEHIPVQDRGVFGDPKDLIIRVETLFDENALNTYLLRTYNTTDVMEIDPTGRLASEIAGIIGNPEIDDEQKMEIIKEVRISMR